MQLLKCEEFSQNEHCAGNNDYNGASRVSKFSEKNRLIILFYALVHTAKGLELIGSFRHAALLFVHTLYFNPRLMKRVCGSQPLKIFSYSFSDFM